MTSINTRSGLEEIKEEIRDRFGPLPEEVKNLLQLMSVRLILKRMGIVRLDIGAGGLTLTFSPDWDVEVEKFSHTALLLCFTQRLEDFIRRDGEIIDPYSDGIINRRPQHGRYDGWCGFTDAAGTVGTMP